MATKLPRELDGRTRDQNLPKGGEIRRKRSDTWYRRRHTRHSARAHRQKPAPTGAGHAQEEATLQQLRTISATAAHSRLRKFLCRRSSLQNFVSTIRSGFLPWK